MNTQKKKTKAICPVDFCGEGVDIEGLGVGRAVICPHCGATLKVTSTDPPKVEAV